MRQIIDKCIVCKYTKSKKKIKSLEFQHQSFKLKGQNGVWKTTGAIYSNLTHLGYINIVMKTIFLQILHKINFMYY